MWVKLWILHLMTNPNKVYDTTPNINHLKCLDRNRFCSNFGFYISRPIHTKYISIMYSQYQPSLNWIMYYVWGAMKDGWVFIWLTHPPICIMNYVSYKNILINMKLGGWVSVCLTNPPTICIMYHVSHELGGCPYGRPTHPFVLCIMYHIRIF